MARLTAPAWTRCGWPFSRGTMDVPALAEWATSAIMSCRSTATPTKTLRPRRLPVLVPGLPYRQTRAENGREPDPEQANGVNSWPGCW